MVPRLGAERAKWKERVRGRAKKEGDRVKMGAKAVGSGKQVQNSDKEI